MCFLSALLLLLAMALESDGDVFHKPKARAVSPSFRHLLRPTNRTKQIHQSNRDKIIFFCKNNIVFLSPLFQFSLQIVDRACDDYRENRQSSLSFIILFYFQF